jgi:hypothetical protein
MSTGRGGDRRRGGRRGHLALVGGIDRAAPEDADWEAFCARIGWQRAEAALPDDYEERLAARVFPEDVGADGPAGVAVEQALRAAQVALAARIAGGADEGWPLAGQADPWQRRARSRWESPSVLRRAPAAWAMMSVAAFLCVAASVVLWRGSRPPVDALACPDAEAPRRATIAPLDDRAAPVDPTERRREAEPPSRRAQNKDAPPSPAPKPRKPVPPGALVARRWRHGDARPRSSGSTIAMEERSGSPVQSVRGVEPALPRDLGDDAAGSASPIAAADLRGPASKLGLPDARPGGVALALPVIPRAWPDGRASEAWTQPASFRPGPAPASGTWSLSPESSRWYGLGLPPSIASAGVPSGLGVMGQVDVGKALGRL